MDLLEPEIWEELFMGYNPIYTRVRDEAPVQYKKTRNEWHACKPNRS